MTICLLYQRLHLKDLLFSLEEQSATELKIIHGGEFEKSIFMQSRGCIGSGRSSPTKGCGQGGVLLYSAPRKTFKPASEGSQKIFCAAERDLGTQGSKMGPRGGSQVWIIPRKGDTPFLIHPARTSFVNILHTHGLENILA